MDKIDLLMQAEAIASSVDVSYASEYIPITNLAFDEPIQSYLSGDMIEKAMHCKVYHEGTIYSGFYHEEPFGKTPVFFTRYDLADYLTLMLRTSRTISIEGVETTQDVVLSNGERSGLFAVIPTSLLSHLKCGKVNDYVKLKSVRDERDIPDEEEGKVIVRCSFNVWSHVAENEASNEEENGGEQWQLTSY